MFGNLVVDLIYDLQDILFLIDENLKEHGISHFNNINDNKLKGYGDAGMGVFEIEKKLDRDRKMKLFISTNTKVSADIIQSIILDTFDKIEEQGLNSENKRDLNIVETFPENEIDTCSAGKHNLKYLKNEEMFGLDVEVFVCSNCNKIELFKSK